MAQAVNVNFRMDAELKKNMEQVCEDMGLSMTTAFTIFAKKSYVSKSKGYSIRDRKKITNTTRVMWLDFVLRKSSC